MIDDDFPTVGVTPFDVWLTKVMFIMVMDKKVYSVDEWFSTMYSNHWHDFYECDMTPEEAVDEELSYWSE